MPLFINPTGLATYGIGICARCSRKMSLTQLYSDPNSPGLMVCLDDLDDLDPYRLPARQTERINLDFVRPDLPIGVSARDAAADNTLIGNQNTEEYPFSLFQPPES